jgi:hypothetical protein
MLFDVGNSHSSDANRTSKQLPASATIDSSSDRDRIDLAGGDGGGRGLDPAAVWLIYSKMNLNSFDVSVGSFNITWASQDYPSTTAPVNNNIEQQRLQ